MTAECSNADMLGPLIVTGMFGVWCGVMLSWLVTGRLARLWELMSWEKREERAYARRVRTQATPYIQAGFHPTVAKDRAERELRTEAETLMREERAP